MNEKILELQQVIYSENHDVLIEKSEHPEFDYTLFFEREVNGKTSTFIREVTADTLATLLSQFAVASPTKVIENE